MSPSKEEVREIGELANLLCGIHLDESKSYLVESRFVPILAKHECRSVSEFARMVRDGLPKAKAAFIDAITTRETTFFRDASPFKALENKVLPELIDSKEETPFPRRLRIWSAACSSGQEPYSIAMTISKLIPDFLRWDISIYATDICDAAIAKASSGVYSDFEIDRGMSELDRTNFFIKQPGGWKVRDDIRSLVRFETRNLLMSFSGVGYFDVIFCRNVAIYFAEPVRDDLFRRLANVLQKEGALFVGHAEKLEHLGPEFAPQTHCRSIYYQPHKSRVTAMSMV